VSNGNPARDNEGIRMTDRDYTKPLYAPRPQSRTSRASIRARIRNRLGTNGSSAPGTYRTLLVAQDMTELLYLATDGRLQLKVLDTHTDRMIDLRDALAEADRSDLS
jgi:hypothetical protein